MTVLLCLYIIFMVITLIRFMYKEENIMKNPISIQEYLDMMRISIPKDVEIPEMQTHEEIDKFFEEIGLNVWSYTDIDEYIEEYGDIDEDSIVALVKDDAGVEWLWETEPTPTM